MVANHVKSNFKALNQLGLMSPVYLHAMYYSYYDVHCKRNDLIINLFYQHLQTIVFLSIQNNRTLYFRKLDEN